MKVVQGNLIEMAKAGEFDIIIHGCNCFNTMGAGIAKQISESFPEAYEVDCLTVRGDRRKLGEYTTAKVGSVIIVNAYTQYDLGANFDLFALQTAFHKIRKTVELYQSRTGATLRIGYPAIGCGIGGGVWSEVSPVIDKIFNGLDHTLVEYNG